MNTFKSTLLLVVLTLFLISFWGVFWRAERDGAGVFSVGRVQLWDLLLLR